MTATQPTAAGPFRRWLALEGTRRWVDALASVTRPTARARPRWTLAERPTPPLTVFELDPDELLTDLQHSRWDARPLLTAPLDGEVRT